VALQPGPPARRPLPRLRPRQDAPQETEPCIGLAQPSGRGTVEAMRLVPTRPWPRRRCSGPWRR